MVAAELGIKLVMRQWMKSSSSLPSNTEVSVFWGNWSNLIIHILEELFSYFMGVHRPVADLEHIQIILILYG